MRVLKNIVITLGLFALAVLAGGMINASRSPAPPDSGAIPTVVWSMVIGCAVWAAITAKRLEFAKYRNGLASSPVSVFLVIILLWAVAFPWFLTLREKIKDGTAELKDEFKHEAVTPMVDPTFHRGAGSVVPPPLPRPLPPPVPMPPVQVPAQRAPLSVEERISQLQRLGQLREQGLLTESEFQSEKQKLLGQA